MLSGHAYAASLGSHISRLPTMLLRRPLQIGDTHLLAMALDRFARLRLHRRSESLHTVAVCHADYFTLAMRPLTKRVR
jgi:hypothetical protein